MDYIIIELFPQHLTNCLSFTLIMTKSYESYLSKHKKQQRFSFLLKVTIKRGTGRINDQPKFSGQPALPVCGGFPGRCVIKDLTIQQ